VSYIILSTPVWILNTKWPKWEADLWPSSDAEVKNA